MYRTSNASGANVTGSGIGSWNVSGITAATNNTGTSGWNSGDASHNFTWNSSAAASAWNYSGDANHHSTWNSIAAAFGNSGDVSHNSTSSAAAFGNSGDDNHNPVWNSTWNSSAAWNFSSAASVWNYSGNHNSAWNSSVAASAWNHHSGHTVNANVLGYVGTVSVQTVSPMRIEPPRQHADGIPRIGHDCPYYDPRVFDTFKVVQTPSSWNCFLAMLRARAIPTIVHSLGAPRGNFSRRASHMWSCMSPDLKNRFKRLAIVRQQTYLIGRAEPNRSKRPCLCWACTICRV